METHLMTKLKIQKPAKELFEAIVDPVKIGNFWFSSSSERWKKARKLLWNIMNTMPKEKYI